jgi:hypothetical protein
VIDQVLVDVLDVVRAGAGPCPARRHAVAVVLTLVDHLPVCDTRRPTRWRDAVSCSSPDHEHDGARHELGGGGGGTGRESSTGNGSIHARPAYAEQLRELGGCVDARAGQLNQVGILACGELGRLAA